jgi:predicted metal-dependent hydrolase
VAVGAGKMMMHLFKVEVAIMMLQGICLKVEFVEFVIQILKKAAKLASEAEARRREAWAWGVRGAEPPAVRIILGFHLYKYLCKPQEISISIVNLL